MPTIILHHADSRQWWHFIQPHQIIQTYQVEQVLPLLQTVEALVNRHGWYAAGFLSYEAAPAFDAALQTYPPSALPLLWFGLFSQPNIIQPQLKVDEATFHLGQWIPSINKNDYKQAVSHIKTKIAQGETYQVNYTFRLHALFKGNSEAFFWQLMTAQQPLYGAYLDIGDFTICSASPELFFKLQGDTLTARPMKGTTKRGVTRTKDEAQATWLRQSVKNQAENLMIVDMIRNDLGRVAQIGTVQVPSLFDVEQYPTIWQMTSTVQAKTNESTSQIMKALFPCASITGAPKASTMQQIKQLESTPRQIYTGSIGVITPDTLTSRAQFNVAIRTVLINNQTHLAEYGIGGGVVWDSQVDEEYEEAYLKAHMLTQPQPKFQLLETILWTAAEGYFLLDYHLARLQQSAIYFGYPVDIVEIQGILNDTVQSANHERLKVRLLVSANGEVTFQVTPLINLDNTSVARLIIAPTAINSNNRFLYHKTTYRPMYALKADYPEYDDVILWNERGEITETCIANLVVVLDGQYFTPPVESGLLAGTFRAWLLDQGKITEKVITKIMLAKAEQIFVINSVRKWRMAVVD